jgi:hypothetical protein
MANGLVNVARGFPHSDRRDDFASNDGLVGAREEISALRPTQSIETDCLWRAKKSPDKPGTPCWRGKTLTLARLTALPRLLLTALSGLLALLTGLLLSAAALLATLTALLTTLVLLARLLLIRIHNCSLVCPPNRQQTRRR